MVVAVVATTHTMAIFVIVAATHRETFPSMHVIVV
jgi:hypothetical protein